MPVPFSNVCVSQEEQSVSIKKGLPHEPLTIGFLKRLFVKVFFPKVGKVHFCPLIYWTSIIGSHNDRECTHRKRGGRHLRCFSSNLTERNGIFFDKVLRKRKHGDALTLALP